MTEDEAKSKWCPQARDSETAGNRSAAFPDDIRHPCIASACMAWRWAGYRADDGTWVRKTAGAPWKPENADGYCGLAGKPDQ